MPRKTKKQSLNSLHSRTVSRRELKKLAPELAARLTSVQKDLEALGASVTVTVELLERDVQR